MNVKIDAPTSLTFRKSMRFLIHFISFMGFGICDSNNHKLKMFYNAMFVVHMIGAAFGVIYAYLKSELTSDDIQKLVFSLAYFILTLYNIVARIAFRVSRRRLSQVISATDHLLSRYEGQEQPFLRRLHYTSLLAVLSSITLMTLKYAVEILKLYVSDVHVDIGDSNFDRLSRLYHIDVIYNYVVGPFIDASGIINMTVIGCVLSSLVFVFDHLPPSDNHMGNATLRYIVEFIDIHRETCRILRLARAVAGLPYLLGMSTVIFLTIACCRMIFVSGQQISWLTIGVGLLFVGYLNHQIQSAAMVNKKASHKLKCSYDRLLTLGLEAQEGSHLEL